MAAQGEGALWTFALNVYPEYKTTLLDWQRRGASVNDLLMLAYAERRGLGVDWPGWRAVAAGRPRSLLQRVRSIRFALPRQDPRRPLALRHELALERWDLALLEDCLLADGGLAVETALARLSRLWGLEAEALNILVQRLAQG